MEHCSPNQSNNTETCFSNKSLIKIAEAYNKESANKKIEIPNIKQLQRSNLKRRDLWLKIKNAMINYKNCTSDYCILKNNIVKKINDNEIQNETFRPIKPKSWNKNRYQWLSTLDISEVMKQYEKKYPDFFFIGPVPIDFEQELFFGLCVSNELCKLDIKKLIKKNKTKLGVIFNLDKHNQSGSHWVALFSDFNTGGSYFYDSYGIEPKKEILDLMEKIKKQGNNLILKDTTMIDKLSDEHDNIQIFKKINNNTIEIENTQHFFKNDLIFFSQSLNEITTKKPYMIKKVQKNKIILNDNIDTISNRYVIHRCFKNFYNQNRFQFKNSECGVYSMHFIEEFLNGKPFVEITNNIYDDEKINKKRDFYYRPN